MKIISWNINGIRAVFKKGFFDWFKKENADIFCLQETKADVSQFPKELQNLQNYNLYTSSSLIKKGYSGVAVFTKEKPLKVEQGIGKKEFDCEGRILKLEFKNFYLFNIYFPNGGSGNDRLKYKLNFYDYFVEYLKEIKDKPIIICGDYNTAHCPIDLARPKNNEDVSGFMPIERKKLDNLIDAGFVDTFRYFHKDEKYKYTWWDYKTKARQRNVGWRLDYFFVSKEIIDKIDTAEILSEVVGSDHCPIMITGEIIW